MNPDLAPFGIVETTPDGRFLQANQAFLEMLAFPSRDALFRRVAASVYRRAEDRRKIMEALQRDGRVEDEELQLVRADGRPVWTRISAHLVDGNIQTYVLPIDEFRETQQRYSEIVESIGAVTWRAERETLRFLEVSDEAERLLGFPREKWFEEGFWESRIHPDDREWAVEFCKSATAANRSHQFEYRMIAADGRVLWVRDMVRVHNGEMSGVLVDISVEKAVGERIRASEERYRSVVDGAHAVIYTTTPDAILTSLNPAFETITGWKAAEWIGRSVLLLLHPDDRESQEYLGRDDVADPRELEVRVRAANGTYMPFAIWGSVRRGPDGKIVERFGFGRDLTQQRQLEADLAQFEQVARVTAVDRIAATMAHEFRNVLMGIGAARDILRRAGSPEIARNAVAILSTCMRRGQAITDDVLRFTHPGELDRTPVDATALLRDVAAEAEALMRGCTLHVIEPGEPLSIDGDTRLLHQALLNLILNAHDVTPSGGTIELAATRADDGRSLHVWVRDEGPGIPPDILPRIFEPLFTTKAKGTGLGLPVAHQIVQMHRGTLYARSEPGEGTTFHMVVPLRLSSS